MAKNAIRQMMLRSAGSPPRWMCTATAETVGRENDGALSRKLLNLGGDDSEAKVGHAIEEWVREGRSLKRFDIISSVNLLRRFNRHRDALQIYKSMKENKMVINNADCAIIVDLLWRVEGVAAAENYFNTLQESAKTKKTYGALLRGYCGEKTFDKAVELFDKMKELWVLSTLNYNNVIHLYIGVGQPEKVPSLVREMEGRNIAPDLYTYNHLMNSYASLKDLDSVEGVLKIMETKKLKLNWVTYTNLANIYINAGNLFRANEILSEMEKMENVHDRRFFHSLVNSYARASNLAGVHRVWESLKAAFQKITNKDYLIMLLALFKLGNVETLEKYFREWEHCHSTFDVRVSNVILESYLKRDMMKEANLIYECIQKNGGQPNLRTLELLANFYIGKGEMDLALSYVELGSAKASPKNIAWFPSDETVNKFLKCFEENYDTGKAEKFCDVMKKSGRLDSSVYDSLLNRKTTTSEVEL